MQKVTRNEYFDICRERLAEGKLIPKDDEYEIIPIQFDGYHLSDDTKRIVNANFMTEITDRHNDYMLTGHWYSNLSYDFAKKCKFDVMLINGCSAYAYSDEQMAIFTYTEGDIYFSPYKDKKTYEKRKAETIRFYKEAC